METIFTISTVIVGLMSSTTMENSASNAIRVMCLSLATASGLCWGNREMQRIFIDTSAVTSAFILSILIFMVAEIYVLHQFLKKSKQQYGKNTKKDWIIVISLFIGILSWVLLYQVHLYLPEHFTPKLSALPALTLLLAFQLLGSQFCREPMPQEKPLIIPDNPTKAPKKRSVGYSDELHKISEAIHQLEAIPSLLEKLIDENQELRDQNLRLSEEVKELSQGAKSGLVNQPSATEVPVTSKTEQR